VLLESNNSGPTTKKSNCKQLRSKSPIVDWIFISYTVLYF